MIYDYYCLDCGNKFTGDTISFDLSELAGLRYINSNGKEEGLPFNSVTHISGDDLKVLAESKKNELEHGIKTESKKNELKHGIESEITISLCQFLENIGKNAEREKKDKGLQVNLVDKMKTCKYDVTELSDVLKEVFSSGEAVAATEEIVNSYTQVLTSRFIFTGDPNNEEAQKVTNNYYLTFWIKPEFLEEGKSDKLYTVQYKYEKNAPVYRKIMYPGEIRGYCPVCGKPILKDTGKVQHSLIGMIGAQSAGKTTCMIAMIEELQASCRELGINRPSNPLCDDKYLLRSRNQILYQRGWSVEKTPDGTSPFNVSILIETERKKRIVSIVDIAGEQCYDMESGEINRGALEHAPLIRCCDIYLLCTCIDQTAYGNADGQTIVMPPTAVVQIARDIFDLQHDPSRIPPLCILVTKADLAINPAAPDMADNPFEKNNNIRLSREYVFHDQYKTLSDTYSSYGTDNIRTPLRWCIDVYEEFHNKTYISMFSISALGRKADKYDKDLSSENSNNNDIPFYTDESGKRNDFVRRRMKDLWRWILMVLGLIKIENRIENPFRLIPSYTERYVDTNTVSSIRFMDAEALARCKGVDKVFMNPSQNDHAIIAASLCGDTWWDRFRGKTPEKELKRILRGLRE